jgi:7-cyano-7-deazaguanine synthase in queuosine biosynthesis
MILLFSGGIDSFIAWHYLRYPQTVYFDLKTPYSQKEIKVIKKLIPATMIDDSLNLSERQHGKNAYIPFRNLYLAMLACHYSDTIMIAGVKDDNVSDKNEAIFKEFSHLLSDLENRPIRVLSPFWDMTKAQIVEWYLKHVDYGKEELLQTISCYSNDKGNYCGSCPSCFRKFIALYANGIKMDFHNQPLMMTYLEKARKGYYIPERNINIIKCVKEYLNLCE